MKTKWLVISWSAFFLLLVLLLSVRGKQNKEASTPKPVDQLSVIFNGPGSVALNIASTAAPNTWTATYNDAGHTAKFQIHFDEAISKPLDAANPFGFGKGELIAVPGSDAATFLPALQKALEGKSLPIAKHADRVPFTYAVLGQHQSRNANGGGFNAKPAGDWTATKLFFMPDAEVPGEVYFNFNPASGQAEFSIKDPDFAETVLRAIASVL